MMLASCARTQWGSARLTNEVITPTPNRAAVTIVRPWRLTGSGESFFAIDGSSRQVLGELPNATTFTVELEPGRHRLCVVKPEIAHFGWSYPWPADWPMHRSPWLELTVEAGKSYLLELAVASYSLELIAARPGSRRAERLTTSSREYPRAVTDRSSPLIAIEPAVLEPWMELCTDASPDRHRLSADEGLDLSVAR